MISDFAKSYLAMQGVIILPPCPRTPSRAITEAKEPEYLPGVPEYERGA